MRNIETSVVADSINPSGKRITTMLLTYPRFIHSELMTHRVFSRNSASSRAIPIEKMLQQVKDYPAHPERWGTNGKGMQDHGLHPDPDRCHRRWNACATLARWACKYVLLPLGLHKQIVNRVLEPFTRMTVVVTSTEWANFFALRAHPDADPTFQVLAYRMLNTYLTSQPKPLQWGDWHTPFAPEELAVDARIDWSVAACARTSYTRQDDPDQTVEGQRKMKKRLQKNKHWSPFEHPAQALRGNSGNFKGGWIQLRTQLDSHHPVLDFAEILKNKPEEIEL